MIHTKNAHLNPYNRSDFILWVMANSPRKDITRWLNDGKVEILGGFDQIPPSIYPGWIIQVITPHKILHNIAVTLDEIKWLLGIWELYSPVPWEYYNGNKIRKYWCLFDGDNPNQYILEKEKKIHEQKKRITD